MLTSDIKNFQVICHFLYTIITLLLLDNYITYHFLTKYLIITLLLLDNYMTYHFLTEYSIITLLLLHNYMTYHFLTKYSIITLLLLDNYMTYHFLTKYLTTITFTRRLHYLFLFSPFFKYYFNLLLLLFILIFIHFNYFNLLSLLFFLIFIHFNYFKLLSLLFILIFPTGGRNPIQALDQQNYNKHNRLYQWSDINESDVKMFLAHIIIMGLV